MKKTIKASMPSALGILPLPLSSSETGCKAGSYGECPDLEEQLINNSGGSVAKAEVGETTQATISKRLQSGRYYVRVHGTSGPQYELEVSSDGVLQATVP